MTAAPSNGAARVLAGLLESRTGQQIGTSRQWRIETALGPLLARHGAATLDDLAARAAGGREPLLADAVLDALLNHETFFFRDMAAFRQLGDVGLARLRDARRAERRLRVWSAGCSTGQEAYSLLMMIQDRPDLWGDWTVEIVATDVSRDAIARARAGRFSQWEIQRGLPVAQMLRRFEQAGDLWQADARLRGGVRFQVHNLLDPPPPGRFDLVLCRNVLLYFAAEVRRAAFARLAGAIAPDGVLMLGAGEAAMGQTDRFEMDDVARSLYRPRAAV